MHLLRRTNLLYSKPSHSVWNKKQTMLNSFLIRSIPVLLWYSCAKIWINCDIDQIPARILRDLADVIAPLLTLIFQKSLDEGNIPNDWRTANVTAIFKKGERYKASNYRPVLCCKVQEHIIVSSILKDLDAHQILTDCQHGFRARRSCKTQLLALAHELLSSLDVGCQHNL